MNDSKSISVSSVDGEEKIIWTYDVCGCFVIIIYSENDESKNATLVHLNALDFSEENLEDLISVGQNVGGEDNATILVFAPAPGKSTVEEKPSFKNEKILSDIIRALENKLPNVKINIEPYRAGEEGDKKDNGYVIIRVQPKGQTTYKTWFSQGQIGTAESTSEK